MTGVGASRLQSSGMRPLAASTSAAARENSRPRKRVSWPIISMGLRLKSSEFGVRSWELRKSAMPWVARRTLSKVKSRAISPRQPLVPNLIISSAFPVKSALLQRINVTHKKHPQERKHRTQNHACVLLQHLLVNHRPGIKKYYFDVE